MTDLDKQELMKKYHITASQLEAVIDNILSKPKRKVTISLSSIQSAVDNGDIGIWVNNNGEIVIEKIKTGDTLVLEPYRNMEHSRLDN